MSELEELREQLAKEKVEILMLAIRADSNYAELSRQSMDNCERCDVRKTLTLQLAAERDESKQRQTLWANEVGILHQQLAAEREKAQQRANEGTKWYLEAKAERHKREACEVLIRDLQKELAKVKD